MRSQQIICTRFSIPFGKNIRIVILQWTKSCSYGDYIWYYPIALEEIKEELDNKIEGLNQSFANHPEIDFHTYYIEKDTDINFETNEQSGIYEYLKSRVAFAEGSYRCV